jgi:hypothetical protein
MGAPVEVAVVVEVDMEHGVSVGVGRHAQALEIAFSLQHSDGTKLGMVSLLKSPS